VLVLVAALLASAQPAEPRVEIKLLPGFGAFEVVNHGNAIELSTAVEVERQVDGRWSDVHVSNLKLVAGCPSVSVKSPKCTTLAAHVTLRPMKWLGNYCYSQCPTACDLDGPVPAGIYRLVVSSCDLKYKFRSAPFDKR
jgi:hypothetical protein